MRRTRAQVVVVAVAMWLAPIAHAQDCTTPATTACAGVAALTAAEADGIVRAAAASLNRPMTIAVVDRTGLPLAVYRKAGATAGDDDQAIGVARTAALFSNDMAPLSSRTVRFISGVHFPPGVKNAPVAALYGIEQSNRGCDLAVLWNPGQCLPRARSLDGILNDKPCNAADASGCGPGIVTGKVQPDDSSSAQVNAGGIPVSRAAKLVAGVGVIDSGGDTDLAEFAAATGAFAPGFAPLPRFPLPEPGNVVIDGLRLPVLGDDKKLRSEASGLEQQDDTSADAMSLYATNSVLAPANAGCAPDGYLAGPLAGSALSAA